MIPRKEAPERVRIAEKRSEEPSSSTRSRRIIGSGTRGCRPHLFDPKAGTRISRIESRSCRSDRKTASRQSASSIEHESSFQPRWDRRDSATGPPAAVPPPSPRTAAKPEDRPGPAEAGRGGPRKAPRSPEAGTTPRPTLLNNRPLSAPPSLGTSRTAQPEFRHRRGIPLPIGRASEVRRCTRPGPHPAPRARPSRGDAAPTSPCDRAGSAGTARASDRWPGAPGRPRCYDRPRREERPEVPGRIPTRGRQS